jgi:chromosome segregation ATPase
MSPSEYEQLVQFLGARFETIDHRFDGLEHRFDGLERRLDEFRAEVLGHFDAIYRRLERLEQRYQAVTQALRRIEALLADEVGRREIVERDLATLRENVAVLKARIDDVERRLRSEPAG